MANGGAAGAKTTASRKKAKTSSSKKPAPAPKAKAVESRCVRATTEESASKANATTCTAQEVATNTTAPPPPLPSCKCLYDAVRVKCGHCVSVNTHWQRNFYESLLSRLFEDESDAEKLRDLLKFMREHAVSYDGKQAMRVAVRLDRLETFRCIVEECAAKSFPESSPFILNDFFNDIISNGSYHKHSVIDFLKVLKDQGAKPELRNVNTIINSWGSADRESRSADLLRWLKNEGGVQPDASHMECAVLRSNVTLLKIFRDEMGLVLQPYFVSQACENLDIPMTKYLIDEAALVYDIDDLLTSLRDAWEHSDAMADRRYEDPIGLERRYRDLRQYLRSKKGWSPEADRARLHVILQLFEAHKETFKTAQYVDIMQFLKRLHDETNE